MLRIRRLAPIGRRRGTVVVLFAIGLVPLLGVAAIALEGGYLMTERLRVQATADAAALAAADMLFRNYPTDKGLFNSEAEQAALKLARDSGYTNDGIYSNVRVNAPSSGYFKQPGYVEVIVESRVARGFSRLWGSDRIPVRGRAVAVGKWDFYSTGILVLDPTGNGSLNAGGGGNLNVNGGAKIIVDSKHPSAVVVNGGGNLVASEIDISGGYTTPGGGQIVGDIRLGVEPTPDPLAYLPQPNPRDLPSKNKEQIANGNHTLKPGVYKGGISISGQAKVTLEPGIYYMDGGGFTLQGGASLIGQQVMIFNSPHSISDKVDLGGNSTSDAKVSITPPTSGLYKGISLFQDRTATVPMNVGGSGTINMTGTFYTANALLKIAGNTPGNIIGSQYISYQLNTSGTAGLTIDWKQDNSARIRTIGLVE